MKYLARMPLVLVASTLLVFAGVVTSVTLHLRARIRAEILGRDASILRAVAQREARHEGDPLGLVLRIVDLDGVIGVRVFGEKGDFIRALPDHLIAGACDRTLLSASEPVSRFEPDVPLCAVFTDPFGELGDAAIPILHVFVPIRDDTGAAAGGFAEFLLDGRPTAEAFHRLDRDLLRQSMAAFLGGGSLIVAILLLSMRQIVRKNRDLAAANRDLALHAKTAAIGAVASHLFHGLKNAVAGLHLAIERNGDTMADASASTRRIETMIQSVIDVIQEESHGISYDLTAGEILDLARKRIQLKADSKGVQVVSHSAGHPPFPNRDANLILLVLENLLTNAIEASPTGGTVDGRFEMLDGTPCFSVTDRGTGIPEDRQRRLFEPGGSSKTDGSGIGLSISRQLCRHFGGELRLARTGAVGTTFELQVPGHRDAVPDQSDLTR